ncbi:MAG: mannose-1-phosphate guanylyltransferase/mannose-6-phosphate isomerase, partial [Desulfobacterales bacterium]|nr:mannose-1-phosphate guanylyltransferase/mannose-6-phosphate isomerase [Desulfobacterales bacterium]
DMENAAAPIVLCNDAHRFIMAEQLRQIEVQPKAIILEPVGRNTAPALAVAALMATARQEDPILLALPADHHIRDTQGFLATVRQGARYAEQGYLVTFGIEPDAPETGYGYIRKGATLAVSEPPAAWTIDRFVEKPELDTARQYVASGQYCWNSGMFMFKAGKLLEELDQQAPAIVAACRQAVERGRSDLDFFRLDPAAFGQCPSDSIDYAVTSDWSDLGSWEALWQAGEKDGQRNVVRGDVCLQDVHDSFVHASSRLVTAVGLSHHVVVETKDAVFVAPRDQVQQVKALVDRLKRAGRPETANHKKVYRPWGAYEDMDVAERFLVKRITVKPKAKLSMQKHFHRAEHWVVVKGTALVTRGDEQFILKEDESAYIPLGIVHRLENPGKIPLELVEIQSGSYLAEDDVVRMDDVYGRHNGEEDE